jgi:hypothetical protein
VGEECKLIGIISNVVGRGAWQGDEGRCLLHLGTGWGLSGASTVVLRSGRNAHRPRDRVLPFASLTGPSDTGREAQKGVRGLARDKAAVSYLGL